MPYAQCSPVLNHWGRVRRADLHGQRVADLVVERARVLLGREVAVLPAPVRPAAREAVEDLSGIGLTAEARVVGEIGAGVLLGNRTPQPVGHAVLGHADGLVWHAGLAKVLLGQDVDGDLAPLLGNQDVGGLEDDGAVRVGDARAARNELDGLERVVTGSGVSPSNVHVGGLLGVAIPFQSRRALQCRESRWALENRVREPMRLFVFFLSEWWSDVAAAQRGAHRPSVASGLILAPRARERQAKRKRGSIEERSRTKEVSRRKSFRLCLHRSSNRGIDRAR